MPRCVQANAVATRPRGVRATIPARTRKGSHTSSTVAASSPTATASVETPTGPPPKLRVSAVQHRAVQPVEAQLVDVVDRQRGFGDVAGDDAVGANLGEVTNPAQQSVGDSWRAPRPTRDLRAGIGIHLDAQNSGGAGQHPLQLGGFVEIHVRGEAEPVAQRPRQRTGPGGRADQGEGCDFERNRRRPGPFADHHVDPEILHRQVEHFLGGPGDAVNLVDEQHVVLDQIGQHRRQVARAFQSRPRRHPQRRAQLGGDDHRQRRLAQPGRPGQQDVIRGAAAVLGALDDQLQLLAHPRLADELPQRRGAAGCRRRRPRRRPASGETSRSDRKSSSSSGSFRSYPAATARTAAPSTSSRPGRRPAPCRWPLRPA